jgi:hypothetical protein
MLKTPWKDWRVVAWRRPEYPQEMFERRHHIIRANLPSWCWIDRIPVARLLELWERRGLSYTPSGDVVSPTGVGPDGAPSWLLFFGVVEFDDGSQGRPPFQEG